MAKRAPPRHRDLQPEARLHEDEGAQGPQAQGQGRQLRRPEARRVAAALGFPAGAGRRPEELGGAQGAEPRPRREPARDADRGSSARLWQLRRDHPRGRIWRRDGDAVGPGPLDPAPRQGPEQDDRGRAPPLHARRGADEGRMGDVPPEAASRGEKAEPWMLKKVTDDFAECRRTATALVDECVTSVTTGRTMAEIASGSDEWRSNRGGQKGGRAQEEGGSSAAAVSRAAARDLGRRSAGRGPTGSTNINMTVTGC